jgi:hypothetical protein
MGMKEEGSVHSFPGSKIETERICFRAVGNYCFRLIALNTSNRKVITRFGRCLRTLYVIKFGPAVLLSLTHLMIYRTTDGLIIIACGDIFVSTHFINKILITSRLPRIIYGLILSLKTVGHNFYVLTV